jgi:hypothetical protein
MNMHINPKKIKTNGVSRRNLLRSAPAAGLAAMLIGATSVSAFAPPPALPAPGSDPIPGWFDEWKRTENDWKKYDEGTPEDTAHFERREELAKKIASATATTKAGLIAQFAWFKDDLGQYVTDCAGDAYNCSLDRIASGIEGVL